MIRAKTAMEERGIALFRLSARVYLGGFALIFGVSAVSVNAQVESRPSRPVATLRVQTNLVQIPVLILTRDREKLTSPFAVNRLAIRLAGGPWVRPKFVRLEGGDPIDLAILVDPRGPQLGLLPKLSQAIARLAPSSLSSRDHVSIYVMGCSAMQAVEELPADAEKLRSAVEIALKNGTNRVVDGSHVRCKPETRVWDALGYVTRVMSDKPGRRAILAITDGDDLRSKVGPYDLGVLAQLDAVTIFGLDATNHLSGNPGLHWADERSLSAVSEQSGGIALELGGQTLDGVLTRFVQMLRDRYIVEFPRPTDLKPGRVELEVRVTGSDFFIRSAGKSVPSPNPGEVGGGTITVVNDEEGAATGSVPAAASKGTDGLPPGAQSAHQPQADSDAAPSTADPETP